MFPLKRGGGGREVKGVSMALITGYILKINVKIFIISVPTERMVYRVLDSQSQEDGTGWAVLQIQERNVH